MYKKTQGSMVMFFVSYVDDVLLIRNDVGLLYSIKIQVRCNIFLKLRSFKIARIGRLNYLRKPTLTSFWLSM